MICSADARSEFDGLNVVDGPAADADPGAVAAVILGDSPDELTKENLDRAFRLVLGGRAADRHAPQPVVAHARRDPTLDAGTFLVGLEWATKRRARIVGKPSPAFFRVAVARLAAEAAARGEPRLLPRETSRWSATTCSGHRRRPARGPADGLRADRQAR